MCNNVSHDDRTSPLRQILLMSKGCRAAESEWETRAHATEVGVERAQRVPGQFEAVDDASPADHRFHQECVILSLRENKVE